MLGIGKSNRKSKKQSDLVVIDERIVSVGTLKSKFRSASMRFWALLVSACLISSMVIPYMSNAAGLAGSDSAVFDGEVVPGYSMGGVTIAAYGVDLNAWAKPKSGAGTVVRTNYGIWNTNTVKDNKATSLSVGDKRVESDNSNEGDMDDQLDQGERSFGWQALTGKTNYSISHPDGQTPSSNDTRNSDVVAPYRTVSDFNFWDSKTPVADNNASASIDVSLYADFIIVSKNADGSLSLLTNPDDATNAGSATSGDIQYTVQGTTAVPYYISLKDIFNAYGLDNSQSGNDNTASIDNLIKKVSEDGVDRIASLCDSNNLLKGTDYSPLNAGDTVENPSGESEAFNPYPYTMVFSGTDSNGNKVVSSIYDNSEAYVFFSPASVYNKYMSLRAEYDDIVAASSESDLQSGVRIVQLGYYAATLAILEAYLDEALPQDATRGYVGPTENGNVFSTTPGNKERPISDITGGDGNDPKHFHGILYGTLMYDIASQLTESRIGEGYNLGKTNAIMDSLSTFGYNNGADITTGVMKGGDVSYVYSRSTMLTPWGKDPGWITQEEPYNGDEDSDANHGIYTPVYYPIQQHTLPESEKAYRFQVLSSIPYETLIGYISKYELTGNVNLSYASGGVDKLSVSETLELAGQLSAQFSQLDEDNDDMSLGQYNSENSIVCSPETAAAKAQDGSAGDDAASSGDDVDVTSTTQERVDTALLNYNASTLTADNVHDMVDIVRATRMLKQETWDRFYNPLKGTGGDNDVFVTRISPAQTTYMPSVLFNGYIPAGGRTVTTSTPESKAFDYFCVPSFAPCFASHTASDTYYGAMSYELRAFYEKKFLDTLSDNANVPQIEGWEETKAEVAETSENAIESLEISKADLLLMYILSKRLAWAETFKEIRQAETSTGNSTIVYYQIDPEYSSTYSGRSRFINIDGDKFGRYLNQTGQAYEHFLSPATQDLQGVGYNKEDGLSSIMGSITRGETIYVATTAPTSSNGEDWNTPDNGSSYLTGERNWVGALKDAISGDVANVMNPVDGGDTWGDWKAHGLQSTYIVNNLSNLSSSGVAQLNSNGTDVFMSFIYEQHYQSLLGENGEYHWSFGSDNDDWKSVISSCGDVSYNDSKVAESNPLKVTVDGNEKTIDIKVQDGEDKEKYKIYIQGMGLFASLADDGTSDTLTQSYRNGIEACYAEITQGLKNAQDDINAMIASMPSQMQNCIAWADYKDATDSEGQYQSDPTQANVVIDLGQGSSQQSTEVTGVTSEEEVKDLGYDVNWDEDGATLEAQGLSESQKNASSAQARMVRGVEGATATATLTPSCYTISATIARSSQLAANSGTQYPYYGIANGRLVSGADRYSQMQAHKVDYTSIASGLSDLNTNRVQPQLVTVTQPEYGTLPNLLDILGNVGAFIAELGNSMLSMAAGAFSSLFFADETTTAADLTSEVEQEQPSADPIGALIGDKSTMSSISRSYTFDNISMNRMPADHASFDSSSQQLVYDTSSATAGAATMIEGWASNFLLHGGASFYALIQSIALVIVMISLLFIAFRNFYAYTVSKNATNIITAQTQLKVVLPRAVIAIFMIGLPPIGDGIGFQGGCYLLLQLLGSVISFIMDIFLGLNGSGVMSMWTNIDVSQFGSNIGAYFLFFIACLIMSVMFLLGVVAVFIQSLLLAAFYFVGPIVWAFYVWPYGTDNNVNADDAGGTLGQITQKLAFGPLTDGRVGNQAPAGWITGYISTALVALAWGILFWTVSMVFLGTSGVLTAGNVSNAAMLPFAQAAGETAGTSTLFDNAMLNVAFATFICVILFVLMLRMAINLFQNNALNTFSIVNNVGKGIKDGIKERSKNAVDNVLRNKADNRYNERINDAMNRGDMAQARRLQKRREAITDARKTAAKGVDGLARGAKSIKAVVQDRDGLQNALDQAVQNKSDRGADKRALQQANKDYVANAGRLKELENEKGVYDTRNERLDRALEHIDLLANMDNDSRAEFYSSLKPSERRELSRLGLDAKNISDNESLAAARSRADMEHKANEKVLERVQDDTASLESKQQAALDRIENANTIDEDERRRRVRALQSVGNVAESRSIGGNGASERIAGQEVRSLTAAEKIEARDLQKDRGLSAKDAEDIVAKQAALGRAYADIDAKGGQVSSQRFASLSATDTALAKRKYGNDFATAVAAGEEAKALEAFKSDECARFAGIISSAEYAALAMKSDKTEEERAQIEAYNDMIGKVNEARMALASGKATGEQRDLIAQYSKLQMAENELKINGNMELYKDAYATASFINANKALFDASAQEIVVAANKGKAAANAIIAEANKESAVSAAIAGSLMATTGFEIAAASSEQRKFAEEFRKAAAAQHGWDAMKSVLASNAPALGNDAAFRDLQKQFSLVENGALPAGTLTAAMQVGIMSSTNPAIKAATLSENLMNADEVHLAQKHQETLAASDDPLLKLVTHKDQDIARNAQKLCEGLQMIGKSPEETKAIMGMFKGNEKALASIGTPSARQELRKAISSSSANAAEDNVESSKPIDENETLDALLKASSQPSSKQKAKNKQQKRHAKKAAPQAAKQSTKQSTRKQMP